MTAIAPEAPRRHKSAPAILLAAAAYVVALGLAFGYGVPAAGAGAVLALSSLVAAGPVIRWRWSVCAVILVILFIPIGEYFLPGNLPFQLEPYRVLVGIVMMVWGASLLADPSVRLRSTGYEAPIFLISFTTLASVVVNPGHVKLVQADVAKSLIFFLSFLFFYYFIASTVNSWADIDFLIKLFVGGASLLGLLALIEYRTGSSVFNQLDRIVPLRRIPFAPQPRGNHIRAQGSAEHPIAFGALMIMTMPLSIYLIRKYSRRWLLSPMLLSLGALASVSRTAVVMAAASFVTILWLRPRPVILFLKRPKTLLVLALVLVVVKVVAPGAIGTLRYEFNPPGGIAADQSTSQGSAVSGGRLTDLGPVLHQVAEEPLLGVGYGTNVTGRTNNGGYAKGRILDDQWLGTLWQTGILGLGAWIWWLCSYLRRLGAAARRVPTNEAWLLTGLAASVVGFAAGMFTYDAFAFIQETFALYLMLSLGALIMRQINKGEMSAAPVQDPPGYISTLTASVRRWTT